MSPRADISNANLGGALKRLLGTRGSSQLGLAGELLPVILVSDIAGGAHSLRRTVMGFRTSSAGAFGTTGVIGITNFANVPVEVLDVWVINGSGTVQQYDLYLFRGPQIGTAASLVDADSGIVAPGTGAPVQIVGDPAIDLPANGSQLDRLSIGGGAQDRFVLGRGVILRPVASPGTEGHALAVACTAINTTYTAGFRVGFDP